jgi:Ca-activated chloride channel family protein
VLRAIDNLELAERTAIGEAIFSCLDAVKTFQTQLQGTDPGEGNAPARIVLMSDGSNTWGRSPEQAVGAAKQASVPVSTIAFGTDTGYIDLEGQRVVVPVDHEKLKEIADGTGGSYYAAASAEELSSVYRDLGSQIGYTTERREITTWFVGIGLLFAFGAAGVSLLWSNRLL